MAKINVREANAAFQKDAKKRVGEGLTNSKNAEKVALKKQIADVQDALYEAQNTIIKELISNDEHVTPLAIEQAVRTVHNTPQLKAYVQKKGWIVEKLDLNAWRKDKILRGCVIEAIVSQNQNHFAHLTPQYDILKELQMQFADII
jgi:hypothetical protein